MGKKTRHNRKAKCTHTVRNDASPLPKDDRNNEENKPSSSFSVCGYISWGTMTVCGLVAVSAYYFLYGDGSDVPGYAWYINSRPTGL